jgi:nucleoside phosphorylase
VIGLVNQIAGEAAPSLLITTGTAGAIGSYLEAGDAVITNKARFYLTDPASYAAYPGITNSVQLTAPPINFSSTYITKCNQQATTLIESDLSTIAKQKAYPGPTRNPAIFYNDVPGTKVFDVVSSNGFSLDDKNDTDGLQQLGSVNDMDDAFILYGLAQNTATGSLPWLSIRNISEPQAPNLSKATLSEWEEMYDAYGMYTTYNSAFACWAVICGL